MSHLVFPLNCSLTLNRYISADMEEASATRARRSDRTLSRSDFVCASFAFCIPSLGNSSSSDSRYGVQVYGLIVMGNVGQNGVHIPTLFGALSDLMYHKSVRFRFSYIYSRHCCVDETHTTESKSCSKPVTGGDFNAHALMRQWGYTALY
jgi:hypothetical protein